MTADPIVIPTRVDNAILKVDGREVRLTNLRKPFWPELGITKGALIQYYADVAPCCCRTSAIARWSCGAIQTARPARRSS